MTHDREETRPGADNPDVPLAQGVGELILRLTAAWRHASAGDTAMQGTWRVVEGGEWGWEPEGVRVRNGGTEWSAYEWTTCGPAALSALQNFVVTVALSGKAEAAGLSFGPFKDFLVAVDPGTGTRRLQLEVDIAAGSWTLRVDGRVADRCWWDSAVRAVDDLVSGALTLKARRPEDVLFHDLAIGTFASSCQLSIILTCYRFLQRLRVTLRNWCHQDLPSGAYEILVVNPTSPDGTHDYLAAVGRAYPHVRVREISMPASAATNKGTMINRALEISRGEWIWLCDADCLFPPNSAAEVLGRLNGRTHQVFFGERRFLSPAQTDALLTGRVDSLADFDRLAPTAGPRGPERAPWGYTQIVHRSIIERVKYPANINHFARSDDMFVQECVRQGIRAQRLDGLFCLHLDHPFAWYGTETFL